MFEAISNIKGLKFAEVFGVLLPGVLGVVLLMPVVPASAAESLQLLDLPLWLSVPAGVGAIFAFGLLLVFVGGRIAWAIGFAVGALHGAMSNWQIYRAVHQRVFNGMPPLDPSEFSDERDLFDARAFRAAHIPTAFWPIYQAICYRTLEIHYPLARAFWAQSQAIVAHLITEACPPALKNPPATMLFSDGVSAVFFLVGTVYLGLPNVVTVWGAPSAYVGASLVVLGVFMTIIAISSLRQWTAQRLSHVFVSMTRDDPEFRKRVLDVNALLEVRMKRVASDDSSDMNAPSETKMSAIGT